MHVCMCFILDEVRTLNVSQFDSLDNGYLMHLIKCLSYVVLVNNS